METITKQQQQQQQQQISHLPAKNAAEQPEMERQQPTPPEEDLDTTAAAAATAWDWGNLLDFTIDEDNSILSWDPPAPTPPSVQPPPSSLASDRVRKRDPRLICENFLAGRVPCSCPEMDEKEEEEEGGAGKKRRTALAALVRCQVPGCEADIRELKGYHRRHRVCLRCASASTVLIDGEAKRYCQQCGKFHILEDFDEGKRSCRRKLERHNNRRRRKSTDCKSVVENEPQGNLPADDAFCDGAEKDMCNGVTCAIDELCLGNQSVDTETILESEDGDGSTPCSVPSFQNIQINGITSSASAGEMQTDGKDYSKPHLSSSFGRHKTIYSSVCPTGRMSFKLYDWNPAEFPRRLRLQIFQWLASMPVELEGYIRPGCTILTLFIAMPRCMWDKLSEDASSFVTHLVNAPESLLSGRGPMHIYLNKMIFKTLKDGSLLNCNWGMRMPTLHYVHPTCFEAGKPMELVACGNNLFQRKFRFLVSFAGRYLAYDSCISFPQRKTGSHDHVKEDSDQSFGHELFKIRITSTDSNLFGPAFIEVENESGLSNFIPVLFVDSQTCSELRELEQRLSGISCPQEHGDFDPSNSCKLFLSRQTAASELLLDVAWLLKGPCRDRSLNYIQIHRFTHLLSFLIEARSIAVLERILGPLEVFVDSEESHNTSDGTDVIDLSLLQKFMDQAREIIHQNLENNLMSTVQSENSIQASVSQQRKTESEVLSTPSTNGVELRSEDVMNQPASTSASQESGVHAPLINKHIIMNVNQCPQAMKGLEWPRRTSHNISSAVGRTRLTLLIVTVVMCFGICVALGHAHEVGRFAISVRRYVFRALNSQQS